LALIVVFSSRHRRECSEHILGERNRLLMVIAAGFFLALHFASWISSLAYTSVASSTALVTTNPIWIALISWLVFREKLSRPLVAGIVVAMLGSVCIFLADASLDASTKTASNPLLGNGLALIGSLTVCGYLLIGRRLSATVPTLVYITSVFAAAVFFLGLFAVFAGVQLGGFSPSGWWFLLALALGPQLMGHGGINWSLKFLTPAVVALAILAEPVGAAVLAWLWLGESFRPLQLVGFMLLMAGIYLATRPTAGAGGAT
jgi:drug/metabolite transporter (DMT)-like permease